jgi:hypothetical protein
MMQEVADRIGFAMDGPNLVIVAERGAEQTRIILKPEDAAQAAFQMIEMLREAAINFEIKNKVVEGYR